MADYGAMLPVPDYDTQWLRDQIIRKKQEAARLESILKRLEKAERAQRDTEVVTKVTLTEEIE